MKNAFFYFTKIICWFIMRVGFGLEVRGQEHVPREGGVLLASNHVSYLDPVVVGVACPRPVGFMARRKLFDQRWLGFFMQGVRVIPLQQDEGDLGAIREAIRRLKEREVVAIFPEGGRQFSGKLAAAKRGVGLIATGAGVPIVPMVVSGTLDALPPASRRPRRAKIRVAFGEPISYTSKAVPGPRASNKTPSGHTARIHHEELAASVTHQWHRLVEQMRE